MKGKGKMKDEDWIKITTSPIQKQMIKKKCPACGKGKLHEVLGDDEMLLYCNYCLCAVDSDGGFTK